MDSTKEYNDKLFKYYQKLRRLAFSIGHASYADDLVHDTMEYFIKNKKQYFDHPNLEALLIMKMKNLNIDKAKSKSGTEFNKLDSEFIREKLYSNKDEIENVNRLSDFRKIFNLLGDKCKEIISLSLDYSYEEISKLLDIKPMTVGAQVSRCYNELKGLSDYG